MSHPIPYMTPTKTGWNYNPPWMRECKAPKPQTMPRPRVEDSAKTIARCMKIKGDERAQEQVRKAAGDFYIAATDGDRALLLPGEGAGGLPSKFGELPRGEVWLDDPEMFLAVKRALIIANGDKHGISIKLTDVVTIQAELEGESYSQRLDIPVYDVVPSLPIGMNALYLLDVLGVWPLLMHYTDHEHMIVFRPKDDSWRYLLMPLKL